MLLAKNRRGLRNYEIIEKFTAGVVLNGHEVKALREKKVNFEGSYIKLERGVPKVVGIHIGRYSKQSQESDTTKETRTRNLLLNKNEIKKLQLLLNEKGKTAVPTAFILRNNMVKLELAVVKGRKKHQNKQVERDKQLLKDMQKQRHSRG